jgi:hypothetical protein
VRKLAAPNAFLGLLNSMRVFDDRRIIAEIASTA